MARGDELGHVLFCFGYVDRCWRCGTRYIWKRESSVSAAKFEDQEAAKGGKDLEDEAHIEVLESLDWADSVYGRSAYALPKLLSSMKFGIEFLTVAFLEDLCEVVVGSGKRSEMLCSLCVCGPWH